LESKIVESICEAEEIKASGRWAALNQKIEQLADNPNGYGSWQVKVFADLSFKNFSEYLALKKAYEDETEADLSLLAWRARNLLEVSVWSAYCASSEGNAWIFYEDAGKDILDLHDAYRKWGEAVSIATEWIVSIEKSKNSLADIAEKKGVVLDGPYQRISKVAKQCNMEQHFKLSYKELSKFAHPTSMLILANYELGKIDGLKQHFYGDGCMFFVGAFNQLDGALSVLIENPV